MSITFDHTGGVGMRAKYRVRKDGAHVADLYRYGVSDGWTTSSVHYSVRLGRSHRTIDAAKQAALTLDYPSAMEAYEIVCERIRANRKKHMETEHAEDFVRLARELIAGSNSAREEIEKLVHEIDTYVADRTGTRANAQAACDRHFEATGERIYTYMRDDVYYPEPPK
jgi:cell division septum initiation protein DivIVA